jgi:hyperosmotically inducible periplasmic protein
MRNIVKHVAAGLFAGGLVLAPMGAHAAGSDAWITAKTKTALMTTKGVSSTAINVDTVDGVVTLHGKINSAEEKARAEAEARKIDGVREVRNLLQVVPERQQKIVKASDKEIKDRVEKTLKQNPDLKDSSIAVQSVNDGVVLLGGKANSVGDHLAAVDAARTVPGVRKVESEVQSPDRLADEEIRREPPSPTAGTRRGVGQTAKDMFITTDVKMRLVADDKTPANDINVDTRNGNVTLFGTVPSQEAKVAAEADARKVSGVTRVMNELEVVPKAKAESVEARDDQLQDQIEKKIKNRDDLKGASIDVDVKNAVARLTGTVENDHQRLAAALAARSVPGVRSVHQELRVEYREAR